MQLSEAAEHIGAKVIYRAPHVGSGEPGEEGMISSVNDSWVFVIYGANLSSTPMATPADRLTFAPPEEEL